MRRSISLICILPLLLGLAGCSSNSSNGNHPAAPAAPLADTSPPAAPVGLSALNEGRQVKLAWQENVSDPDLAGYRVTRTARGQTIPLTVTLQTENRFIDSSPFAGLATYAVQAVDSQGNESAAAVIVHDYRAEAAGQRLEF
jgi:hypothetical protein